MYVLRGDHLDALRKRPIVHFALQRRADADLNHSSRFDQAFQDRVIKDRAVGISLPEIPRPCVDVRIEVDQRRRALSFRQRSQQGQGHAVIAAQRDEVCDLTGLLLDALQAAGDVSQRDDEVADVGQMPGGWIDPMQRMLAVDQHPARLSNCRWSESRSRPVGRAKVIRNAGDTNRRIWIAAGGPEKRRRDREGCGLRHDDAELEGANRNTAAATAQVQSPRGAPSAAAAMERVSTMRSLIS